MQPTLHLSIRVVHVTMYFDKEIFKKLDQAKDIDQNGHEINLLDINIKTRGTYIARDIKQGNIDLAIDRISMLVFTDSDEKPGEYITRLIKNRCSTFSLNTGICIYALAMLYQGHIERREYNKVHDRILDKLRNFSPNRHTFNNHKEVISYYDMNAKELGILSYLF